MPQALAFFLDPYDRKARLQPALLSALPFFVSLVLLIPQFGTVWGLVSGTVVYCGGTMFLKQLVRDRGKAHEQALFRSWDGKPSVAMLRHRDCRLFPPDKKRYRAFLKHSIPGLKLASKKEEKKSPQQADLEYQSATSWLIEQTRDRGRFGLIFRESMNYGFRRNLLALKPWALALDTGILLILALRLQPWTGSIGATLDLVSMSAGVCAVLIFLHMLAYVFVIRPDWVRVTANEYAQRLLAACDVLSKGHASSDAAGHNRAAHP